MGCSRMCIQGRAGGGGAVLVRMCVGGDLSGRAGVGYWLGAVAAVTCKVNWWSVLGCALKVRLGGKCCCVTVVCQRVL